jgi:uncharacterized protein YlxW (UPF0749 family)
MGGLFAAVDVAIFIVALVVIGKVWAWLFEEDMGPSVPKTKEHREAEEALRKEEQKRRERQEQKEVIERYLKFHPEEVERIRKELEDDSQ